LNRNLNISYDFFVRTTMKKHHEVCHWLYTKATQAGDIYLGSYE
jgi:methionyl-tRNA synthetase